jgi:hypothetical protein
MPLVPPACQGVDKQAWIREETDQLVCLFDVSALLVGRGIIYLVGFFLIDPTEPIFIKKI